MVFTREENDTSNQDTAYFYATVSVIQKRSN